MKHFFRTMGGKALLLIVICVGVVCLGSAAVGTAALAVRDYYTRSVDTLKHDYYKRHADSYAYELAFNYFYEYDASYDEQPIRYKLLDQHQQVLDMSPQFKEDEVWAVSYITVIYDEEGVTAGVTTHEEEPFVEFDVSSGYEFEADEDITQDFEVKSYPNPDSDAWAVFTWIETLYKLRYLLPAIGLFFGVIAFVAWIILMHVSGRRPDQEEIEPGNLAQVPVDLLFIMTAGISIMLVYWMQWFMDQGVLYSIIPMVAIAMLVVLMVTGWTMTVSVRIKRHTLMQDLLVVRFIRLCIRGIHLGYRMVIYIVQKMPLVWKTALFLFFLSVIQFFVIIANEWEIENILTFWVIEKAVLIPVILVGALNLRRLQQQARLLAGGNLSQTMQTDKMFWDFKRSAEDLNSIGRGMQLAVQEQTKSERMKTELLTNVSHDIKTPLTSIINYATLIGQEETENEKIHEYAEVLTRQSVRLKRLIEDLVEASKASTGNLDVELVPCNTAILLTQAAGEYEERLEALHLEPHIQLPDHDVMILADGRRMWRIFDNLLNNICKYAMEGTRVYLSLEDQGQEAVITFRNISRDSLNVNAQDLMERFVRGDKSRGTEGNGLGLSIAESLCTLQHGSLQLIVDGDLFKAVLRFPKLES